jgi:L-threonylcarbamoyladenylate synthase
MDHFWPGPLTLILSSKGVVSELVTAGLTTVGLRMPNHRQTLDLLQTSNVPLAAPSANRSGKPSPTHASHVVHDMENRIAGLIDGGACEIGLESTVIDMTSTIPIILRPGGISKEQIECVIGKVDVSDSTSERPKAPGMKYTHYSPDASVYIVKGTDAYLVKQIQSYQEKGLKVGVLCLDSARENYLLADVVKGIGEQGKNLYAALREFDEEEVEVVLCEFFDHVAVMNRLLKASEERILSE